MKLPSFADPKNLVVYEDEPEVIELGPGETSLSFLQRVYRSVKQPMSRRMRAAIEALPHEHPRLGAVAIGSMNGDDFATMLDRAIERSGNAREVKQIETAPTLSAPLVPHPETSKRLRKERHAERCGLRGHRG